MNWRPDRRFLDQDTLSSRLLANSVTGRVVEPPVIDVPWNASFLYEDGRHVFYVTTTDETPRIVAGDGFVTRPVPGPSVSEIPRTIIDVERLVPESPRVRINLGISGTVAYDDREIGVVGVTDGVFPRRR